MRTFFPSAALLVVFLLPLTSPASEPEAASLFQGFVGKYTVSSVECTAEGTSANGCDLNGVALTAESNGKFVITEIGEYGGEEFPIEVGESRDDQKTEKAFVSGNPDYAVWQMDRFFADGTGTTKIKLFARFGSELYYEAYRLERDSSGTETVLKQTYTIKRFATASADRPSVVAN